MSRARKGTKVPHGHTLTHSALQRIMDLQFCPSLPIRARLRRRWEQHHRIPSFYAIVARYSKRREALRFLFNVYGKEVRLRRNPYLGLLNRRPATNLRTGSRSPARRLSAARHAACSCSNAVQLAIRTYQNGDRALLQSEDRGCRVSAILKAIHRPSLLSWYADANENGERLTP